MRDTPADTLIARLDEMASRMTRPGLTAVLTQEELWTDLPALLREARAEIERLYDITR